MRIIEVAYRLSSLIGIFLLQDLRNFVFLGSLKKFVVAWMMKELLVEVKPIEAPEKSSLWFEHESEYYVFLFILCDTGERKFDGIFQPLV